MSTSHEEFSDTLDTLFHQLILASSAVNDYDDEAISLEDLLGVTERMAATLEYTQREIHARLEEPKNESPASSADRGGLGS